MRAGWVLWLAFAGHAAGQDTPPDAGAKPEPPPAPTGEAPVGPGGPPALPPEVLGLVLRVFGQGRDAAWKPGVPTPICVDLVVPTGAPPGAAIDVVAVSPLGELPLWRAETDAPPGSRRRLAGLGLRTPDTATAVEARWVRDDATIATSRVDLRPRRPHAAQIWLLEHDGPAKERDACALALRARAPPNLEAWEREEWRPPWAVIPVAAEALPPTWLAFAAADAVVLAPPLESPPLELALALTTWTDLGGRVLVGGGELGRVLGPGFWTLLPVTPGPAVRADLLPLQDVLGADSRPTVASVTGGVAHAGRRYAATPEGAPLCLLHERGLGRVLWLACAIDDPDVRGLGLAERALAFLLRARARSAIEQGRLAWVPPEPPAPSDDDRYPGETPVARWVNGVIAVAGPGVPVPPPPPDTFPRPDALREKLRLAIAVPARRTVGLWLAGYLAVAAALVLWGHRRSRVGRAWLAVGALGAAGFVALTGVAAATFDTVTAGQGVALCEGALGSRRVAMAGTGTLYTPIAGATTLALPAPADRVVLAARPAAGLSLHAPTGAAMRFRAFPRAIESVEFSGALDLGGPVTVEPAEVDGRPGLRVHNGSLVALGRVRVAHGATHALVGPLPPGASRTVALGNQTWRPTDLTESLQRAALRGAGPGRCVLAAGLDLGLGPGQLGPSTIEGAWPAVLVLHGMVPATTGVEPPAVHAWITRAWFHFNTPRPPLRRATLDAAPGAGAALPARIAVAELDGAPWWATQLRGSERITIECTVSFDTDPGPGARLALAVRPTLAWARPDGRAPPAGVTATVHHFGVRETAVADGNGQPRYLPVNPGPGGHLRIASLARHLTSELELHLLVHVDVEADDWAPAFVGTSPDPAQRLALALEVAHPAAPERR